MVTSYHSLLSFLGKHRNIEIIEEIEDNGIFNKFDSFLFFALFVINVMN